MPWIAVFYSVVTISATQGYYVVYLFNVDDQTVCLSLNQGTTAVRKEFGDRIASNVLRDRAALMRSRVSDYARLFDCSPIGLGSTGALPKGYEAGHAFGRTYLIESLPNEQVLENDLQLICKAYLPLQYRGGLDPSVEEISGEQDLDRFADVTIEERKRYRVHQRIERNSRAAKLAKHGRRLSCQACGFDFGARYGELGLGYIEAQHLLPLSHLGEGQAVTYRAEDFALLCSNCHRMIHRLEDPSRLDSLIALLGSKVSEAIENS